MLSRYDRDRLGPVKRGQESPPPPVRSEVSGGDGISYDNETGEIAVVSVLAAYASGDVPSPFFLGLVDSPDQPTLRAAIGAGTVTSVDASGGTTGLSFTGGSITGAGTLTLGGTLGIANGGTGATSAATALSNLGGAPTSRSISTGTGLVGGGNLTTDRTLSLATSGVTAGSYGSAIKVPTITVDVYGRVTIVSENTIPALASGTYTPTLFNVTNLAASTPLQCQYMRVGNVVTVSGRADVDPTAAGATRLDISLPIPSNFTDSANCGGVAAAGDVAGFSARILADATNDRARVEWIATDTAVRALGFSFTYLIQ